MAAAIAVVVNDEWEARSLVSRFLKGGGAIDEMPSELVVLPDGKVLCLGCLPKILYVVDRDELKVHVERQHRNCYHTCYTCSNGFRSSGGLGTHKNVTRH